jgi:iron complex outermembrane receptor protein
VVGNPSFVSEVLLGYEAGFRTLITPKLYVDLSTFYNDYSDLSSYGPPSISLAASPILHEVATLMFINGIRGTTKGLEIAPDWKLARWIELKGSYSYLYPHLTENTSGLLLQTAPTYNGSSPRTQIVGQSLLNLPKRFELDLTYRYVSALPAQAVRAYSTGDVRVGWHATPALEFSVGGQNLFQREHAEFGASSGLPVEIERNVYGKITWARPKL